MTNEASPDNLASLRARFPQLSEAELAEADDRLTRYVQLALAVYDDVCRDDARRDALKARLTESKKGATTDNAS